MNQGLITGVDYLASRCLGLEQINTQLDKNVNDLQKELKKVQDLLNDALAKVEANRKDAEDAQQKYEAAMEAGTEVEAENERLRGPLAQAKKKDPRRKATKQ